jgi:2,4-dienoyl-CoA reductase-like NADH-dependent reductase (Old Yellow Enzyme family)
VTGGLAPLLAPLRLGEVTLANRFVMAPMTRSASPDGVPGPDVAEYYRKRAAGGVALLISEGAFVPHPSAGADSAVPALAGGAAAEGWARVVASVHAEGAAMFCQLWHQGAARESFPAITRHPGAASLSPSGVGVDGRPAGAEATPAEVEALVAAYVEGARFARDAGFDGVEVHGAHGYLVDQFLWPPTNRRRDGYGDPLRFATDVVRAIRADLGPAFPIAFRFSQWKTGRYDARLADDPDALGGLVVALRSAGVDVLHPSTRRFWEPAFPELDPETTLAGWTRRLSGLPTVAVGSVGLDRVFIEEGQRSSGRVPAQVTDLDRLVALFERGEFDLVAVGRALLADPDWVRKHREGRRGEIAAYEPRFRDALL